jgi:Domain of unknown function (DUF4203)
MGTVAASVRLIKCFYWLVLCDIVICALALPFIPSSFPQLVPRGIVVNNSSGTVQVFDSTTEQEILQGPATDGSGTNFSLAAAIWLVFCFVVGIPMAIAGIRGWRVTIGIGIGLSAAACGTILSILTFHEYLHFHFPALTAWAAFINSLNATGVPDLLLTAIVMAFFFLGSALGLFEFARKAGLVVLGISGGMAFGIRVMLLKEGLLISKTSLFAFNWVLIAVFGVLGAISMVWYKVQRGGIVGLSQFWISLYVEYCAFEQLFATASVGTFLISLGFDLVMHKQSGMSRGLRTLFDRNPAHLAVSIY